MVYKPPSKSQVKKLSKFLSPDEKVISVTSIGTRYFWMKFLTLLPMALLLVGLSKLGHLVRMKQSYVYALTSRRFIIIRGLFARKIVTAPLVAITHVTVEQTFIQRFIYGTGDLIIITAGFDQREIVIENIANPVAFKILIEELTEKLDGVPREDKEDNPEEFKLRSLSP